MEVVAVVVDSMPKVTKRGFVPTDAKQFNAKSLQILKQAGEEIYFLLNRGYSVKTATTFVGNHYLLSERQRLALARIISPEKNIMIRKNKELSKENLVGETVYIDGFNTIITLEIAFSNSLLLECMDGSIRDLAGLRGTYCLIDKTDLAIQAMCEFFQESKIKKAVFYLDKPISNSGRLKQRILELMAESEFEIAVEIENPVDLILKQKHHVVTADAIILDTCESWYNLTRAVIAQKIGNYNYIKIF